MAMSFREVFFLQTKTKETVNIFVKTGRNLKKLSSMLRTIVYQHTHSLYICEKRV